MKPWESYPRTPQQAPNVDGLEMIQRFSVEPLPIFFTDSIDQTIENIKSEYQQTKNGAFLDAIARMEQCLFRLYEAKYLILAHFAQLDLLGFAFDHDYHDFVTRQVQSAFNAPYAAQEYDNALSCVREKNYAKAGVHFRHAAVQGHVAAQYNYGISLTNGEIGEADPLQGAFWFFLAAKGGYEKAMINLAIGYRNGTGVYPNGYAMLYWYAKAASIPFPYGVYNLGLCLENEEVIRGNAVLGSELKRRSEQLQDPDARTFVCDIASQVLRAVQNYVFNV